MSDSVTISIREAVAALLAERGPMDPAAAYAALWPYVQAAAAPYAPRAAAPAPSPARDRRVRSWQYVARFWDSAGELIADTNPEVMEGTGSIPEILASLAVQYHGRLPDALNEAEVKARLPQLRNNLGRGARAVLRIPYADAFSGESFICQMDIHRLEV